MFIRGSHPNIDENYRTYLTLKALSGQTDMNVQAVSDIAANDFLVIGRPGEDLSEIKRIGSIAAKVLTLSANLDNTHSENTKLYVTKYDKIRFYKASSVAGTYALQSTKDIAIGEKHTLYEDTTALSTDYYKIAYYNSYTGDLSPYSDPITPSGFARHALVNIIERIYKKFGDTKKEFLTMEEITEWVNEAKDDLCNEIAETNEKFFNTKLTIALDGSGESDLPDDFKKAQKVKVGYAGTEQGSNRAGKVELEDIDDQLYTYDQGSPVWYFNNFKVGVRPVGTATGNIYLWYEAHPADLANDSDELPKPIDKYLHLVDSYCLARAYEKDKKFNIAGAFEAKYINGKLEMLEHINNIVLDENRKIRDNEPDGY